MATAMAKLEDDDAGLPMAVKVTNAVRAAGVMATATGVVKVAEAKVKVTVMVEAKMKVMKAKAKARVTAAVVQIIVGSDGGGES